MADKYQEWRDEDHQGQPKGRGCLSPTLGASLVLLAGLALIRTWHALADGSVE